MKKQVQELRWDPILGEWVMVSNIRESRPWQPKDFCPFCPGAPETGYGWDVLILKNKYPMLSEEPLEPYRHRFYNSSHSYGKCYVVIETPKHDLDDISDLSVEEISRVIHMVRNKFIEESTDKRLVYFLFFRNKGREIGVSLTHPHSQIYVLPFIPVKVFRELVNSNKYYQTKKQCIFCNIIKTELEDRERIVYINSSWIAFIPYYAHWPFEVHIYPYRHIQTLRDLDNNDITLLAQTLKIVLCGLKNIFENPMPYILVMHQAPIHGNYYFYHFHIEIYGIYRTIGKQKFAAGMETGGGNFTYDSTPEEAAEILRNVIDRKCSLSQ